MVLTLIWNLTACAVIISTKVLTLEWVYSSICVTLMKSLSWFLVGWSRPRTEAWIGKVWEFRHCYGPNACAPCQFICWNPNHQNHNIRGCGLWERIRSRVRSPQNRVIRRGGREFAFSLSSFLSLLLPLSSLPVSLPFSPLPVINLSIKPCFTYASSKCKIVTQNFTYLCDI